ncbi:AMP-binding protein [Alcaligenaceae bacterium]|nr:AMP-binding protein [Alcaligenaceae bacterium]
MMISPLVSAASALSMPALFERQVRLRSDSTAVESGRLSLTYAQLDRRAWRLAQEFRDAGVRRGDRICVLSENDPDFIVMCIAALRLGATLATLNPRLAIAELRHCISLVTPRILCISGRQQARFDTPPSPDVQVMAFGSGTALDARLGQPAGEGDRACVADPDPEDIQFIIYTSGTTGLPKAAMISQRAMLARIMVYVLDYGVDGDDTFLAWSPLCHMASIELGFGTLLLGGKVVVLDGPDLPAICGYLETEKLSNLIFFPGMVDQAIAFLKQRRPKVRGLKKFGALADLFNPHDIARLTELLGAPFTNTFGSTETGMPPLSAGRLRVGEVPADFGKLPSSLCELRLLDKAGRECAAGEIGELVMRGPTLFSGYWAAPDATAEAFRGGWFHSGDMFRRRADGRYDYVDRSKYLIKSGGENIYPAEIERVVLQHPGIADAVVVRRKDAQWGEVPVLVAVARDAPPPPDELLTLCRRDLAAFKLPKDFFFIDADALPRSSTGKVVRSEVESWVAGRSPAAHR